MPRTVPRYKMKLPALHVAALAGLLEEGGEVAAVRLYKTNIKR